MPPLATLYRYAPIALTLAAMAFFIYTVHTLRPPPASARYKECLVLAHDHPDIALHTARVWQSENSASAAAKHCEALALFQIKQYPEAAKILEDLAHSSVKSTPDLAVTLLIQAANARNLGNNSMLGMQDLDYALTLSPNNPTVKELQAQLTKKQ